jgi:arylsulfatase
MLLIGFSGAFVSRVLVAEPTRPNVIILLVDDMGYGDIAAQGNPMLKTPNFDKLHEQSVRLTNFAVSPSCGPTRAALLTGKHEFLSGNVHTLRAFRDMSLKSVTGKWHLGLDGPFHPGNRGFEETLHCIDDNYKKTHFNPELLKNGVDTKYKGYRTDIFFEEALGFIERQEDGPFFLYLATHSPHSPTEFRGNTANPTKRSSSGTRVKSSEPATSVWSRMWMKTLAA